MSWRSLIVYVLANVAASTTTCVANLEDDFDILDDHKVQERETSEAMSNLDAFDHRLSAQT